MAEQGRARNSIIKKETILNSSKYQAQRRQQEHGNLPYQILKAMKRAVR